MNTCSFLAITLAVVLTSFEAANRAAAQDFEPSDTAQERASLFDSIAPPVSPTSSSDYRQESMTASELRQARALYRSRQRILRQEHNAWMGHEPLRPTWNAIPMMSSRYPARRTIYVPVYVWK